MTLRPAEFTDELNYWDCSHPRTEIRWRLRRNGVGCWALQCLACGREVRAIAKNSPEALRLTEKKPFDESLAETIQARQRQARDQQWQRQQQAAQEETERQSREWWRQYNQYLKTPEWRERRSLVLERSGGVCEGCRKRRAVHIHHLTYEHVGNELLFELVALCKPCHRIIHPDIE